MAVFNKNSLTQVSGFDNPIIAGELVWNQQTYWNLTLTGEDNITPVNLTGAIIDAQIVRRTITNVKDSRNGLTFDIGNYIPTPAAIPLNITNRNDAAGSFTLLIADSSWGLIASDVEMKIDNVDGAGFSGRIKIGFPSVGSTPPEDNIIFLFFIVRSDAIVQL